MCSSGVEPPRGSFPRSAFGESVGRWTRGAAATQRDDGAPDAGVPAAVLWHANRRLAPGAIVVRLPTMFVVRRPADRWELRESTLTPSGPRSRTLATFRELDDQTIRHATAR